MLVIIKVLRVLAARMQVLAPIGSIARRRHCSTSWETEHALCEMRE
jgi:hypothetical protein